MKKFKLFMFCVSVGWFFGVCTAYVSRTPPEFATVLGCLLLVGISAALSFEKSPNE